MRISALLARTLTLGLIVIATVSRAETVFTADFQTGLPGWEYSKGGTIASVEKMLGEAACVVRRDPKATGKGTNWSLTGKAFPVVPGRRVAVIVRARSSFKDLRFCNGYLGRYINGLQWYGRDGKKMPVPFGFGYDLDANGWRYTIAAAIVPEGASTARLELGMDTPNFSTNDWLAVSQARVEMSDPKTAGSVASLRDDGMVLVDDKPFFPIGIYAVSECERNGNSIDTAFRDLKAAGFNMVHRAGRTKMQVEEFLSLADSHGLKVFQMPVPSYNSDFVAESVIPKVRHHPSLLAWYLADDTANHVGPEVVAYRDRACKAFDPARLTLQADGVLVGGANCRYERFVHATDVFLPEIYPVYWKEQRGSEVSEVVRDMRASRAAIALAGRPVKSIWPIIQHFDGWGWKRFPTFEELRAMSWEAIVQGGNGIVWYVYNSKSGHGRGVVCEDRHWKEMATVSAEIASFTGDLLSRTAPDQPQVEILSGPARDYYGFKPVSVLLKTGDAPLLATVNAATNAVKAVVRVRGFSRAEVLGEGRALDATDGIVDEWGPYGVRLYRLHRPPAPPGKSHADCAQLTLAARGCPPDCTIVLPAAPAPSQAFAAAELQKYVRAMTGVTLPIATNVAPARGIFLGNGAPALGNDGFRLVATPPHFRIEGSGVHGTLFGVYDFLERYCGCEWLAPNTEVVPQRDKIEVSATLDDVQKPAFPLRDQNWTDHLRNVGFSAKLKLNGFRIEYPEELGGRDHAKDTTTGGAIFDSLCPPSKFFKDHPDWFALVDGKRRATRAQRCLTNTGFLDFLVAQMKERLRKNYPRCKYYSIYPNDFRHNCQCADCKALDDREGSPSASLVHMANYVAERVCKDYPDVRILTFAYMYTLKPPKTMKVHPNVMICYCTDACDFSKPIRESRWKGCREFVENFRKWKALTDKIYIWDYSANFKYLFQPFECTHVMPGNFRYFKEMGVFGVFEEGDHYGVKCVDEALKTWVIGHLLWNPDQPLEPLLDRFFKGYYGAAADVARGYYEALVEQERRRDEEKEPLIMWGTKLDDPYQPIEFFHEWSAKWTAALEKVKDDPIRRENVYWARHNVDLVRIVRSKLGAKYSLATCVADDLEREGAALKPVAGRVLADFARVKGLNKFRDSEMVRRRVESLAQFSLSEKDRRNARVAIPVSSLRVDDRPGVKRVDDPLAAGGKAVRLEASAIGEMHHCLAFHEESFLKDPGAKIGVRVHARVERTGVSTGSVFSVGTCDIVTYRKRDIRNFHVDVAKVADDGYAWYDVEGAWTPAGNEVLWISNGKRVNEVNPCINAVFFDQIELYRKDAAEWIAGAYVPPAETDTAAFFAPARNDVVECAFRTRDVAVARAVWHVAAPGMRDLFVNGERVSPTALPPFTPYRKRVLEESFDVTAHVRKGENTLRVELGNGWYNPLPLKMWYVYNLRDHLAVGTPCVKATLEIAYTDGRRETVATDGSWRARQGRIVHNSIYLGVVEDRRLAMDAGGQARVVKGPPGKVVAAGAFPKTVVYGRWTAQRVTQLSNDVWLVDMGVNAAGTLRARLRGVPRGGKVRLRQGERVWPDGTVNVMTAVAGQIKDPKRGPLFAIAEQRDSVIGDGSPEFTFEPRFTFHVFRYVQVEGPCAAPRPEDFEMCAWSADVKERAHFTCSNEKLNRLHEVCRRTFRANLQSVQSDCPGREKFGYGGDIACTADAFWLNYDMAEFYRKTLRDFLDEAEDDGLFTETAPFVGIASKSVYPAARQTPNAMIAQGGTRAGSIGWAVCVPILVDSLVRYDGDLDSARLAYPALVRYIDLVAKRYPSNDLPECLGDHVAVAGEKHYWKLTSLAHWHQFVTLTAKIARLLGKTDDAARLRELAGRIAAKFRADYVHDGGKVGSGLQGEQLFALYHGLLAPKDVPAAYALLKKDLHAQGDALTTGIFGTKYLLEYLPLHGDAALAARVAMHEGFPGWFNMLDCGATTLWQQWSAEKCQSVSSNCHPMFGSVDEWLIRHVLGISVCDDAVGCDKVRIAPQPVPGVTSASGWLDTPKGRISVSWKLVDGKIEVTSDAPEGITIRQYPF